MATSVSILCVIICKTSRQEKKKTAIAASFMSVSLVSSSFLFQNLVDSTKQKGNLLINGCFFSGKSRRDVPDPCPDSCILILWREGGTGKFLAGKTHHVGEEHEYKAANMWLWAQCQRPSA